MTAKIQIRNVPDGLRARLGRYAEVKLSVAPAEAIREGRGDF